jgi:hypothetical protein
VKSVIHPHQNIRSALRGPDQEESHPGGVHHQQRLPRRPIRRMILLYSSWRTDMQEDKPEPTTMVGSDLKQIIADAIRLRVVTVSRDQSKYAAEDVLAQLKKAGYELRKK